MWDHNSVPCYISIAAWWRDEAEVFVVLGRPPRKAPRCFLFAIFDSDLESRISAFL